MVLAVTKENFNAPATLFKTYDKSTGLKDCKIWEVVRATSAATTFFKSIKCVLDEIEFIDAGFGYNNPCRVLLEEAKRQFPDAQEFEILSIGAGLGDVVTIKNSRVSILEALKDMASNSDRVAREMDDLFEEGSDMYFRFNVERGLEDVTLSDWEKTSRIAAHTHNYINTLPKDVRQIWTDLKDLCGEESEKCRRAAFYVASTQADLPILEAQVNNSIRAPSSLWSHERCIIRYIHLLLRFGQQDQAADCIRRTRIAYRKAGLTMKAAEKAFATLEDVPVRLSFFFLLFLVFFFQSGLRH